MKRTFIVLLWISIPLNFFACSKSPSPRVVVMDFIEAVNKADTASIEKYMDFNRFAQEKIKELPPGSTQEFTPRYKEQLVNSYLGDGLARSDWQNKIIVVNDEKIMGDSALVEVTFLDQKTGLTDYTHAKLYKKDKKWVMYYIVD
jgi:hypothetical protein